MIKILFFAKLRENLGQSEYTLDDLAAPLSIDALRERILRDMPAWREVLCAPNVIIACNQEVVSLDSWAADGDEIAFYPPVTGG
jgi:molybdopterin synthase sulfur carrier subunit